MKIEQPEISVVVCAYTENRWQDLIEAVKSLKNQTRKPHEVIIVIDHNDSLFRRSEAEFTSERITVIKNHHPRGLSGARNSGISIATGDVIAFMDEDAIAAPDWLYQTSQFFR